MYYGHDTQLDGPTSARTKRRLSENTRIEQASI